MIKKKKTLQKVNTVGTTVFQHRRNLNLKRSYMTNSQLTSYSTVKSERISFKIRNKTRMSTLAIFIEHSFGSPSHSNRRFKICYRKLLQLINEFRKVAGKKINIQKFVAFLYTNKELSERETENNSLTTASKRIKYLGIDLPKEAKDLLGKLFGTDGRNKQ